MGDVHRLILQHGLEGARSFAATKAERGAIEAAASMLSEEESRLGITLAGFAMTSLPHKRIEEGKRPVSPALLNSSPRADTTDLKALHKVEVKVDAGRNDRGDHGARAPAALEP